MKKLKLGFLFFVMFSLAGCLGDIVEVPAAHVGKVKTEVGFQDGIKQPSSFRLPWAWNFEPALVLAEVSDRSVKENMKLYMPKDELYLEFDIQGTFSISPNAERVDAIFDRVTAEQDPMETSVQRISFDKVYNTYARQVIHSATREVMAEYTIADVLANREAISAEMEKLISVRLKTTPISVRMFGLAQISPPPVIVTAQAKAKAREIAIQEAEADREVEITKAEARLEVAKKQQEVDLLEAETQVMVQKVLDNSVSKAYVMQKMIVAFDKLATSENKVVVISEDVLQNPAAMVGVNASEVFRSVRK